MLSESTRAPKKRGSRPVTSKPMTCEHCGRQKLLPPNRWAEFRFCSYKCHWDWKAIHDRVPVACAVCGTGFTVIRCRGKTAKYCSRRCYYKGLQHRGSIEVPCGWCDKIVRKPPSHAFGTNYCSMPCRANGQSTVKLVRRRSICGRCGWADVPETLVLHHQDRNKRNNAVENLELLCWNCHMVEHYRRQDGPYRGGRRPSG